MGMIALVKFTADIDGKPVVFRAGDKISDAVVKKLGLADKPNLAGPNTSKPTKTE
ncbi:MAG: hypothetical protein ACPGZR_09240 [Paracoccaceae bacterium]|jgi:hypothetical protein